MAVEERGPTPTGTKAASREGKQAGTQWTERANSMKHEPEYHDTVCTRRAGRKGTEAQPTQALSSVGDLHSQGLSWGVVFGQKLPPLCTPERMGQPRWSAHETMQESGSQTAGNFGARHCSQDSRDNSCVNCDPVDDLQSLTLELRGKVEKLRRIRSLRKRLSGGAAFYHTSNAPTVHFTWSNGSPTLLPPGNTRP